MVYTQPTTVVETPSYGGTNYYSSEPVTTYYPDSNTSYVEPDIDNSGTTYNESEYTGPEIPSGPPAIGLPLNAPPSAPQEMAEPTLGNAPPTIGMPPSAPAESAQQPVQQQEAPRQPDPGVLKAVGKGNEYFGAGRYDDARQAYGEAMAIDEKDGVAKLLYGLAYFADGDFTKASSYTRRALEATPDLVWYPFNIKTLYRDPAKLKEQLVALAQHADAQPHDQDSVFLLGYLWYASGDAQNARTTFSALATTHPGEELYLALRDASNEALEYLSRQSQSSAPTKSSP